MLQTATLIGMASNHLGQGHAVPTVLSKEEQAIHFSILVEKKSRQSPNVPRATPRNPESAGPPAKRLRTRKRREPAASGSQTVALPYSERRLKRAAACTP